MNKKYYAFFDVDGTISYIKSMFSFLRFYYTRISRVPFLFGLFRFKWVMWKIKFLLIIGKKRIYINRYYYRLFCGERKDKLLEYGKLWYLQCLENKADVWCQSVVEQIIWHQKNGAEVVMVSGSMRPCLLPIAKKFGINYIIATDLDEKQGFLTGEISGVVTLGAGKAEKIQQFLHENDFNDFSVCYAYGDHESDIPMMSLVGNPVAIKGDQLLEAHANKYMWKMMER